MSSLELKTLEPWSSVLDRDGDLQEGPGMTRARPHRQHPSYSGVCNDALLVQMVDSSCKSCQMRFACSNSWHTTWHGTDMVLSMTYEGLGCTFAGLAATRSPCALLLRKFHTVSTRSSGTTIAARPPHTNCPLARITTTNDR